MERIQYEDGFALTSPESNKGKIINAKKSGGDMEAEPGRQAFNADISQGLVWP